MEISEILNDIREHGLFRAITRKTYAYDMGAAREAIMAIGRERTQRFALDDDNKFAYENMVKWVMGDTSMRAIDPDTKRPVAGRLNAGIYVAGGTGTGKSWLLEIMSAFCLIDRPVFLVGDERHALRWRNYRADMICDEYTANGTIDRYKRATILGIQDLGSEPRESLYMGNRLSVIGSLIETRGDRTDCITLISSNLPINHARLKEMYGDRVASRLAQMCNYFEMRGKDRRKAI